MSPQVTVRADGTLGSGRAKMIELARRHGALCVWCSAELDLDSPETTRDHLVPQQQLHYLPGCPEPLVLACYRCNNERSQLSAARWLGLCEAAGRTVRHEIIAGVLAETWAQAPFTPRLVFELLHTHGLRSADAFDEVAPFVPPARRRQAAALAVRYEQALGRADTRLGELKQVVAHRVRNQRGGAKTALAAYVVKHGLQDREKRALTALRRGRLWEAVELVERDQIAVEARLIRNEERAELVAERRLQRIADRHRELVAA